MNFILNNIHIPIKAGLDFTQSYEAIGGTSILRMQSGRAVKQSHYTKIRTELRGRGWVPTGLEGLNYSETMLLKCAAPRVVSSTSNIMTIPASRREDIGFEVKAFAIVGGELLAVELDLDSNIARIKETPGAVNYQVHYYPELMVFAEPIKVSANIYGAEFSWSLICEEI